ncbi:hypothetical protein U8335_15040 [Roseiconus lacunae]|uniref:hypothetical protein n=1 Tax=Roseiconus lacunae TaxID=2605694 RepID=UPI003090F7A3|nr:hypothetical protein U8335_15040 [Stieleria sp. HD01]
MRVSAAETFGGVTQSPEFADESTERWQLSEEVSEIGRETRDNARKLMIASAKQAAIWSWRDWGEGDEDSTFVSIQTRGIEGTDRYRRWRRASMGGSLVQSMDQWFGGVELQRFRSFVLAVSMRFSFSCD